MPVHGPCAPCQTQTSCRAYPIPNGVALRSVNYDPFKQVAVVRSLLFPGYTFYYAGHDCTWGALYMGDGVRNNDLIFML